MSLNALQQKQYPRMTEHYCLKPGSGIERKNQ